MTPKRYLRIVQNDKRTYDITVENARNTSHNVTHLSPCHTACMRWCTLGWLKDTETDVPQGSPGSAICVQKSDGSLKSAIHNAYRISLRPSSMREPRHPLLKVFRLPFHAKRTPRACSHHIHQSWIYFKEQARKAELYSEL